MPEDKEINTKLKVANQNIIVSISHIKTANKETQDGLKYCVKQYKLLYSPSQAITCEAKEKQELHGDVHIDGATLMNPEIIILSALK